MSLALTKDARGNFRYNRSTHVDHIKLGEVMTERYMANTMLPRCIVTSSGMGAIDLACTTVFAKNKGKKINLVYSWELYCDSPRLFEYYQTTCETDLHLHETVISSSEHDNDRLVELFSHKIKDEINILFVESCSNMSGFLMDPLVIPRLRSLSQRLYVIFDNTWLTSTLFNPFKYDVNIVVTSLTKHYSMGSCIAGAVLFRSGALHETAKRAVACRGMHVSPHNCSLVLKNIDSMDARNILASAVAIRVAEHLESMHVVEKVLYPLLPSHPSYRLRDKVFTRHSNGELLGPNVFSFIIKRPKNVMVKIFATMKEFPYKTSYGGEETRIDSYPSEFEGNTWCRISIGHCETVDSVVRRLTQVLLRV